MLRHGHDNLSLFKIHDFRLSSLQADNQLAGKSLSHMQTFGYHDKKCLKYVIIAAITQFAYVINSFPPTGYLPVGPIT